VKIWGLNRLGRQISCLGKLHPESDVGGGGVVVVTNYELREDGGRELRETGDFELRE
jgi:hypothetical protein